MAEPHSSGHYDSCGADRQTCTVYVTLLVQVAVEWEYPGQLIAGGLDPILRNEHHGQRRGTYRHYRMIWCGRMYGIYSQHRQTHACTVPKVYAALYTDV